MANRSPAEGNNEHSTMIRIALSICSLQAFKAPAPQDEERLPDRVKAAAAAGEGTGLLAWLTAVMASHGYNALIQVLMEGNASCISLH